MIPFLQLLLFVSLSHSFSYSDDIVCRNDEIHEILTRRGVNQEKNGHEVEYAASPFMPSSSSSLRDRRSVVDVFHPLRIKIDSTQLDLDGLSPSKASYVKTYIFPDAMEWIAKLLNVVPLAADLEFPREESPPFAWCSERWGASGPCKISRSEACNHIPVPKSHMAPKTVCPATEVNCTLEGGTGVFAETDVVIYVSAQQTAGVCGPAYSTLAYASTCVRDQIGRPIFGSANLCPDKIDPSATSDLDIQRFVAIMVHEVFHALGFSYNSFGLFRYPDGSPRGSSTLQVFSERGHSVEKIVTETAVTVASEFFECETLNGVEIEDGGGPGTAKSHPEMRVYQNDFMNGVIPSHPVYSDVTLAIMQDSGWYRANFSNTQRQFWGAGAGCSFAMLEPCLSGPKSSPTLNGPVNHFCTEAMEARCTADRKAIGFCIMYGDQSIPSQFQYFSDSQLGGAETNDYCPVYRQVGISGTTRTTDCLDVSNLPATSQQFFGEKYGSDSACFVNNLRNFNLPEYVDGSFLTGKCYRYQCNYGGITSVVIYVSGGRLGGDGDGQLTCTDDDVGTVKPVVGGGGDWNGGIRCPDLSTICPGPKPVVNCPTECQNGGSLSDCVCSCPEGWGGNRCQHFTCFGVPNTYASVCSGHGLCSATDVCNCTEGYKDYVGGSCEFPICYSEFNDSACSFPNGSCVAPGECDCRPGFIGAECTDDITDCLGDVTLWDHFDGGAASRGGDCGVLDGVAVYFGGDFPRRQVVQHWRVPGNYSLRFWIIMGSGGPLCVAGGTNYDVEIVLQIRKSADYLDENLLLRLPYEDYSAWESIEIPFMTHFQNRLVIRQPSFVDFKDQWSVDNLAVASFPYIPPFDDDPSYVPPPWYLDLLSWLELNWPIALGVGLGTGACCVCCLVFIVLWIVCCCRKKKNQIHPLRPRGKTHPKKR